MLSISSFIHQIGKSVGLASDTLVDQVTGESFPLMENCWGEIGPMVLFPTTNGFTGTLGPCLPQTDASGEQLYKMNIHVTDESGVTHKVRIIPQSVKDSVIEQLREQVADQGYAWSCHLSMPKPFSDE